MRPAPLVAASLSLLAAAPRVVAWGVAGHQIVATIAEIHLHDNVRQRVAAILPDWANGHLAPVAAWADRIRYGNPWSGELHYVSPLGDDPPDHCAFDGGWRKDRNVFTAIANYSQRIVDRVGDADAYVQPSSAEDILTLMHSDIDLRFLVHFIGDVHQPLHLMERERGGNGDPIIWERRHMSLHGLWDTAMIARAIRDINNYTRPLPSPQIERALTGSIYDSYVRWILWEGVRLWWRDDLTSWLDCPDTLPSAASPLTADSQLVLITGPSPPKPTCPEQWAKPIHEYTCKYVFPPGYDAGRSHHDPPPELATPAYYGRIQRDKVLESLLAQAGLRLASSLNLLLGGSRGKERDEDHVDWSWLAQAAL